MVAYNYVVIGAGFAGATIAQQLKENGAKVLVVDKNDFVGGNCHTTKIHGIHRHDFGPHIFHTNSKKVWDYVNRFSSWMRYSYRPRVNYNGSFYSFPINLMTMYQLWGVSTPKEAIAKLESVKVKNADTKTLEGWALSQVGEEIYEKFIKGYSKKQWQRDPNDLPAAIIKRIPFRTTFDDSYFGDDYEAMPVNGYTQVIEEMLEGCEVQKSVDFFSDKTRLRSLGSKLVYTGKIDQYFDFTLGDLEYRTLEFEHKILDESDHQGVAVINYTSESVPYTRSIEHKHFQPWGTGENKTILTLETPVVWSREKVPYYPINDDKNNELSRKYKELAKLESDVIFAGRLGNYHYYNMDQVIAQSLNLVKEELRG